MGQIYINTTHFYCNKNNNTVFVNIISSTGLTGDKTIETRVLIRSLHPLHWSSLLSHFLLHSHFYPSHQLIQPECHMTLKLFQIYQLKDLKAHRVVPPAEGVVRVYNSPPVIPVPDTTLYSQRKRAAKAETPTVLELQANGSTKGRLLLTSADTATCLKPRRSVTVVMLADLEKMQVHAEDPYACISPF